MADSSINWGNWNACVEASEFSMACIIMETVFRESPDLYRKGEGVSRWIQLIEDKHLFEDWYHGVWLDSVFANQQDIAEFAALVCACINKVGNVWPRTDHSFFAKLSRPEQALRLVLEAYPEGKDWKPLTSALPRLAALLAVVGDEDVRRLCLGHLGWAWMNREAASTNRQPQNY